MLVDNKKLKRKRKKVLLGEELKTLGKENIRCFDFDGTQVKEVGNEEAHQFTTAKELTNLINWKTKNKATSFWSSSSYYSSDSGSFFSEENINEPDENINESILTSIDLVPHERKQGLRRTLLTNQSINLNFKALEKAPKRGWYFEFDETAEFSGDDEEFKKLECEAQDSLLNSKLKSFKRNQKESNFSESGIGLSDIDSDSQILEEFEKLKTDKNIIKKTPLFISDYNTENPYGRDDLSHLNPSYYDIVLNQITIKEAARVVKDLEKQEFHFEAVKKPKHGFGSWYNPFKAWFGMKNKFFGE